MNPNFLAKRSGPKRPPDIAASLRAVRKVHATGPTQPAPLNKRPPAIAEVESEPITKAQAYAKRNGPKKTMEQGGIAEIRDLHKAGGRTLDGDFLSKVAIDRPPTSTRTLSLKKRAPTFAPAGVRWEKCAGTWVQIEHDGRGRSRAIGKLAKGLKVPPQSDNASNATDIADTGAPNRWDDEETASPGTEHVGGFDDTNVPQSDPRIVAAVASTPREREVDAIKQALLPKNKLRMMP